MRLVVTLLWCFAAVIWLPWLMLLVRFLIDLGMGVPWNESEFLTSVLGGVRPVWRILGPWQVLSWIPLSALIACGLAALGWRIYWREQEGRLTRSAGMVALSILVPPLAPWIMWSDTRRRYLEHEAELERSVESARRRVSEQG